jgi:hypothetical protein
VEEAAMSSDSNLRPVARGWIKTCVCGRTYSREEWVQLPAAGFMNKGKAIAGELLELKMCACGSSLAVDLGDEPDSLPALRAARPARRS